MTDLVGTRDIYGETLARLGEFNQNIVVLDADLSASTKTGVFAKKYPERFFNMGVSEQDMMGTAAGLAASGKIPFASTFAIFATGRAWEQIRQSIAYPRLNVKIVASHGGITVGEDGASHQSIEDIALMRVLPNMTVIVPSDGVETNQVIETIIEYQGPVYVRVSRGKTPLIFDESYRFEIGKGKVVLEGNDATVFTMGTMLYKSMEAARMLKEEGINIKVVNLSTIKPIDKELVIAAARETKAVVTVEEHSVIGGLGSAVAELLGENCPVFLSRIGIQDRFGMSGNAEDLLKYYGLTPESIAIAAKNVIKKKMELIHDPDLSCK